SPPNWRRSAPAPPQGAPNWRVREHPPHSPHWLSHPSLAVGGPHLRRACSNENLCADQLVQTGACYARAARPNTNMRLLEGMSLISSKARPVRTPRRARSAISPTPHSGSVSRRLVSNTALETAVCLPARLK